MNSGGVFAGFTAYQSTQFSYSSRHSFTEAALPDGAGTEANGFERTRSGTHSVASAERTEVELRYSKTVNLTYTGQASSSDSAIAGAESRTKAANTILGAVSNRLLLDASDGASKEALESRLSAGLEGFVDGYNEAYKQLSELGFLQAEVETAIESTFSGVLDGVDALAAELGINSPVSEDLRNEQLNRREAFSPEESTKGSDSSELEEVLPVEAEPRANVVSEPSLNRSIVDQLSETVALARTEQRRLFSTDVENLNSLVESSTFNYRAQESREFNFSLSTQDGDTVQIKAAFAKNTLLEGETVQVGASSAQNATGLFRAASGFFLEVNGELDEEELVAIEDLLNQVREVSDLFFAGDIESAFNAAIELGFDSDEIADYSLKLRYRSIERYETQAQVYDPSQALLTDEASKLRALGERDESLLVLARFVQALNDLREKADGAGIGSDYSKLASEDNDKNGPSAIVRDLFESLEKLQASE